MNGMRYFLLMTLLLAADASAQSACLPTDAELDLRVRATRRLAASGQPDDVNARQHQQLPAVADTSVQAVSVDSICVAARDSYDAALPAAAQRGGRRVYVIRVGDRYVVEDPTLKFGEYGLMMVLDQAFAVLSKSTR
jgi:hypothetical protein